MTTARWSFTCSFINAPSPQIVIVGGKTGNSGYGNYGANYGSNSVEILNLDNRTMTRGK